MSFKASIIVKKVLFVSGHILLTALVLLQSLAIQISIPETVLCIEDNGYIMLEKSGTDIHCEYLTETSQGDETAENIFHESNCIDIPLEKQLQNAVLKKSPNHKIYKKHHNSILSVDHLNSLSFKNQKSTLDYPNSLTLPAIHKNVILLI